MLQEPTHPLAKCLKWPLTRIKPRDGSLADWWDGARAAQKTQKFVLFVFLRFFSPLFLFPV